MKYVFSESEEQYIREHFPTGTIGDIADHLGLSAPTVSRKVREMGLRRAVGWNKNLFHGRYVCRYTCNKD